MTRSPPSASELQLVLCHTCKKACSIVAIICDRCGAQLHHRKPNSLIRTWALLLTGMIFYVPANLMPVMRTDILGHGRDSTIMSGVIELWKSGAWDIALLIFVASVVVPCMKFLIMFLLLTSTQRRSRWRTLERSNLYRIVERIGYWSMLDVLVVAVLAALVQFQLLSNIEPRIGIVFFGLVVVFTMLASMSFDPRLIWDSEVENV
ncbi:paraquat-inducible membrane protein A [Pseudomonas sp. FSL R10-0056]|nr:MULTISPECIES: paraquat-inducible protein A [Pseudomonas]MBX9409765.1 paraquat-inducible protein A [Pseudomonas baetica]MQT62662.1 paraquat-inducible membrane protein A [Pseudomonas sp. FSL R10-0056]MQT66565.1 paraquat-inducible membrane protein A [Pseudomonas sp. FSL R10-0071]MQU49368.1 paraquat-inducible membrane protein A [Pseudomonas sp. FSL A6-1183]